MHTWHASQGILIGASPSPPPPTCLIKNGPDTVQRKAGRREGEEAPPHWTEDAKAALKKNKQERISALLCNIKPAN